MEFKSARARTTSTTKAAASASSRARARSHGGTTNNSRGLKSPSKKNKSRSKSLEDDSEEEEEDGDNDYRGLSLVIASNNDDWDLNYRELSTYLQNRNRRRKITTSLSSPRRNKKQSTTVDNNNKKNDEEKDDENDGDDENKIRQLETWYTLQQNCYQNGMKLKELHDLYRRGGGGGSSKSSSKLKRKGLEGRRRPPNEVIRYAMVDYMVRTSCQQQQQQKTTTKKTTTTTRTPTTNSTPSSSSSTQHLLLPYQFEKLCSIIKKYNLPPLNVTTPQQQGDTVGIFQNSNNDNKQKKPYYNPLLMYMNSSWDFNFQSYLTYVQVYGTPFVDHILDPSLHYWILEQRLRYRYRFHHQSSLFSSPVRSRRKSRYDENENDNDDDDTDASSLLQNIEHLFHDDLMLSSNEFQTLAEAQFLFPKQIYGKHKVSMRSLSSSLSNFHQMLKRYVAYTNQTHQPIPLELPLLEEEDSSSCNDDQELFEWVQKQRDGYMNMIHQLLWMKQIVQTNDSNRGNDDTSSSITPLFVEGKERRSSRSSLTSSCDYVLGAGHYYDLVEAGFLFPNDVTSSIASATKRRKIVQRAIHSVASQNKARNRNLRNMDDDNIDDISIIRSTHALLSVAQNNNVSNKLPCLLTKLMKEEKTTWEEYTFNLKLYEHEHKTCCVDPSINISLYFWLEEQNKRFKSMSKKTKKNKKKTPVDDDNGDATSPAATTATTASTTTTIPATSRKATSLHNKHNSSSLMTMNDKDDGDDGVSENDISKCQGEYSPSSRKRKRQQQQSDGHNTTHDEESSRNESRNDNVFLGVAVSSKIRKQHTGDHVPVDDVSWMRYFNQLTKYHERHGTFHAKKEHDRILYEWVIQQTMLYQNRSYYETVEDQTSEPPHVGLGTLSDAKYAKLKDIGFLSEKDTTTATSTKMNHPTNTIVLPTVTWEDQFERLKQYFETHGTFDVKTKHDRVLRMWTQLQMHYYKNRFRSKEDSRIGATCNENDDNNAAVDANAAADADADANNAAYADADANNAVDADADGNNSVDADADANNAADADADANTATDADANNAAGADADANNDAEADVNNDADADVNNAADDADTEKAEDEQQEVTTKKTTKKQHFSVLSDERYKKLLEIGFPFPKVSENFQYTPTKSRFDETKWNARLDELVTYHKVHGTWKINPKRNKELWEWERKVRRRYCNKIKLQQGNQTKVYPSKEILSDECYNKLCDIGYEFPVVHTDHPWDRKLKEFVEYHKTHNTWKVIPGPNDENKELFNWERTMRYHYRNRIRMQRRTKEQQEKDGTSDIHDRGEGNSDSDEDDEASISSSGSNSSSFRRRKKYPKKDILSDERYEKLCDVGYDFESIPLLENDDDNNSNNNEQKNKSRTPRKTCQAGPRQCAVWDQKLRELVEYHEEHGQWKVDKRINLELWRWEKNIRFLYRNMMKVQQRQQQQEEEAQDDEEGNQVVNGQGGTSSSSKPLSSVSDGKEKKGNKSIPKRNILSMERYEKLKDVGYEFPPTTGTIYKQVIKEGKEQIILHWDDRLQELVDYHKTHGTWKVDPSHHNHGLWIWEKRLRFMYSCRMRTPVLLKNETTCRPSDILSDERYEKLLRVGYEFPTTTKKSPDPQSSSKKRRKQQQEHNSHLDDALFTNNDGKHKELTLFEGIHDNSAAI